MSSIANHQPLLLFLHVPKTAGTSIRHALQKAYEPAPIAQIYSDETVGMQPDAFLASPLALQVEMAYGHFFFGLHEWLDRPVKYIAMLRNPVDRVLSLYRHYATVPEGKIHHMITKDRLSLDGLLDSGAFLEADNGMIRQIAGFSHVPFKGVTIDHWNQARRNIKEHFAALLVMEQMPDSIDTLSEATGRPIPEPPVANVGNRQANLGPINEGTLRRLRALNRFDALLYEYALDNLRSRSAAHSSCEAPVV